MTNIQVILDIELSQMFKRLREIHGLENYVTEDWFAGTDMFKQILEQLEYENSDE
jgi:hypothetical protein